MLHFYETSKSGIWNMAMAFLLTEKTSSISFDISFVEGEEEVQKRSGAVCAPLNVSRPGVTWGSVLGLDKSGHICVYFDSLACVTSEAEPP